MPTTMPDTTTQSYAHILIPEQSGGYSAALLEFPGCFAEGETADEAVDALDRAAVAWIEAAVAQGQTIPPPLSAEAGWLRRLQGFLDSPPQGQQTHGLPSLPPSQ